MSRNAVADLVCGGIQSSCSATHVAERSEQDLTPSFASAVRSRVASTFVGEEFGTLAFEADRQGDASLERSRAIDR